MKDINIFCFGFGQVAKNFIKKLSIEEYNINLSATSRSESLKKKFNGIDYNSYLFNSHKFDQDLVVKLKEGKFEKFMGFMQSEEAIKERSKVADLSKTIATVSPDKSNVMFKIYVHDELALKSFVNGSNPVSRPVWEEVMLSYEIFELNKV